MIATHFDLPQATLDDESESRSAYGISPFRVPAAAMNLSSHSAVIQS